MTTHCDIYGAELARSIKRTADERGIPLTGGIDLTSRCNLSCVHCYIPRVNATSTSDELFTSEIKDILSQAAEHGCLFMLLSGGEPLLRPDFAEIYTHAKELGLLVTVFTNGTLVDRETVKLFRELPPQAVEISLYGITPQTYRAVTGSASAFERAMRGIHLLHNASVRIKLKSMLMSINQHEMADIEDVARRLDVSFRLDAALFPRLDGDTTPVAFRVEPEVAVRAEFSEQERADDLAHYHERMAGLASAPSLYTCGAGRTSFHIDARGRLKPCLLTEHLGHNAREVGFEAAWKKAAESVRNITLSPHESCLGCEKRSLCSFCPAFNRLETGTEAGRSDYLCALGRERLAALEPITTSGERI